MLNGPLRNSPSPMISSDEICASQIGLSPSYWAHVPLMVAQIHSLKLVKGFSCLVDDGECFPVSRCCLVGCIVSYEQKMSGSSFVLDDGTGLIDCIYWQEDQFLETLPPLVADSEESQHSLRVGYIVKVMGRLECRLSDTCNVVRELRVSLCQPLHFGSNRRAAPFSLDVESRHILRVERYKHSHLNDILDCLGANICKQITEKHDFPSTDDSVSAWRLFGVNCKCPSTSIKTDLLYCPCIATPEPLDTNFIFRNKLLELLFSLSQNDSLFFFQYKQLMERRSYFNDYVSHNNFSHLLQRTLSALRTDGIIYLYHEVSDTYLLITRQGVLEPYIKLMNSQSWEDSTIRMALLKNSPDFLRQVPKGKIQLVRRMLQSQMKQEENREKEVTI